MNEPKNTEVDESEALEAISLDASPIEDMMVYGLLRDTIRTHLLWKRDLHSSETNELIKRMTKEFHLSLAFRLVGEIELEQGVFEFALWLEDSSVYTLASVDALFLKALRINFGRMTLVARELLDSGLRYHLIAFGNGHAQEYRVDVIGPHMQHIRDLGTLARETNPGFSA